MRKRIRDWKLRDCEKKKRQERLKRPREGNKRNAKGLLSWNAPKKSGRDSPKHDAQKSLGNSLKKKRGESLKSKEPPKKDRDLRNRGVPKKRRAMGN